MSKLGDMFVLGQRVSIAAKEEASRYDLPQIDVDHLLLALLVGSGPAGELLRAQGLSLTDARRATEQVRADHIGRLGIVPPAAEPRPIRDPSIGDIDWSPRALKVVSGNSDGGELTLLTGLLDEPSGLVVEVLTEAGTNLDALRAAVVQDAVSDRREQRHPRPDQDWRAVTHTGFAPAPVAEVWALVADLARRPEWDSTIGSVEPLGPDRWQTTAASARPDGRAARPRPDFERAHHQITAYEPEEVVEWEVTLPDQRGPRPGRQRLRVGFQAVAGGTALELTLSWPRRTGWGRVRQTLLHPAHRAVATITLLHYTAGISRTLR